MHTNELKHRLASLWATNICHTMRELGVDAIPENAYRMVEITFSQGSCEFTMSPSLPSHLPLGKHRFILTTKEIIHTKKYWNLQSDADINAQLKHLQFKPALCPVCKAELLGLAVCSVCGW